MKTSLLIAALLCLSAVAVRAADAPAKPADAHQAKCDKIDADLAKVYAGKVNFITKIKVHHLLSERHKLKCPGQPPSPPAKK